MEQDGGPGGDATVACFSHAPGGEAGVITPDFASSLLEESPYPVLALDCAFEIAAANSAARRLLGIEEVGLPAPASDFLGGELLARLDHLFSSPSGAQSASLRAHLAPGDGTAVHVKVNRLRDSSGRMLGVTVAFSPALWDQYALPQNCIPERVEALGLYVAGIVHEFGNFLSVIAGRAGLGLMANGPSAKNRAFENVLTAARRAEHVTKNLLTYVQRHRPDLLLVDLRQPIQEAIALLEVEFTAAGVEMAHRLDALPAVQCDPVQIAQACFNLLRNARDAMPEGGTVTITLKRHGCCALLAVSDTGGGIPPEIQTRLFEPFVSHGRSHGLKPSGTGLGLFITREIVLAHGGDISVDSEPDKGATFTIRLPLDNGA